MTAHPAVAGRVVAGRLAAGVEQPQEFGRVRVFPLVQQVGQDQQGGRVSRPGRGGRVIPARRSSPMAERIRYFAFRDEDGGSVTALWRVRDDGQGVWGEVLHDGVWAENQAVLGCLYDPGLATEVSAAEAAALAARLGGTV